MNVVRRTNWYPSLLNDLFNVDWVEKNNVTRPAVNIMESEEAFKIEVAAPGLTKEDFHVEVLEDNQLVISVEKKTEKEEEMREEKYLRRDFYSLSFRQNLLLPDNVDSDNIEAKVENGILSLIIPKKKDIIKAPKQILIN